MFLQLDRDSGTNSLCLEPFLVSRNRDGAAEAIVMSCFSFRLGCFMNFSLVLERKSPV